MTVNITMTETEMNTKEVQETHLSTTTGRARSTNHTEETREDTEKNTRSREGQENLANITIGGVRNLNHTEEMIEEIENNTRRREGQETLLTTTAGGVKSLNHTEEMGEDEATEDSFRTVIEVREERAAIIIIKHENVNICTICNENSTLKA